MDLASNTEELRPHKWILHEQITLNPPFQVLKLMSCLWENCIFDKKMRNTFSGKLLFYICLIIIILNLEAFGSCLRGWDVKLIRDDGLVGR